MRKLFLVILILAGFEVAASEKGSIRADFEFLSRHYWRGAQMGNAPAFEPNVTYSIKGFSLSVWAAVTANESYTEVDIIPSYTLGNFTATLYDYYNPVQGETNKYLDFSDELSRHSLELALKYNGQGLFPLTTYLGTFLYGDKNKETGDPFYSTYLEFAYPFLLANNGLEVHAGLTPFKGYYSEGFALVSTGIKATRKVKLAPKVEMPVKLSFFFNPDTSKAFFIFGLGISKI